MDFSEMVWQQVKSIGDRLFFLDNLKLCSAFDQDMKASKYFSTKEMI